MASVLHYCNLDANYFLRSLTIIRKIAQVFLQEADKGIVSDENLTKGAKMTFEQFTEDQIKVAQDIQAYFFHVSQDESRSAKERKDARRQVKRYHARANELRILLTRYQIEVKGE